jgi:hypothetical protein
MPVDEQNNKPSSLLRSESREMGMITSRGNGIVWNSLMSFTISTTEVISRYAGWLCPIVRRPLIQERNSAALQSAEITTPIGDLDTMASKINSDAIRTKNIRKIGNDMPALARHFNIIDMTINAFRDYLRRLASDADASPSTTEVKDLFARARTCRMVAREGGFLEQFDRAVNRDKNGGGFFSKYNYNFGKYYDNEGMKSVMHDGPSRRVAPNYSRRS